MVATYQLDEVLRHHPEYDRTGAPRTDAGGPPALRPFAET